MENISLKMGLEKHIEHIRKWDKIYSSNTKIFGGENNTVIKFIVPLLQMLGWEPRSENVEFEYYLQDKNGKKRHADIALYVSGSKEPKILVEAKRFQVELKSGKKQIFKYLVGSKVKYGLLTNGKAVELYCSRFVRHDYKKATRYFVLKHKDFVKYSDVLSILSREMVEKGKLDGLAKAYQTRRYWKHKTLVKNGNPEHDDYERHLLYAKMFLKDEGVSV